MPTALEYAKAAAAAEKKGDMEAATYFRSKYQAPEEKYDATEGMSGKEKFGAGLASGVLDAGRNITNVATKVPGLKKFRPEWASDEAINEQRQTDADLLNTGAGMVGNIVGGAAATAPIGGAAFAGVRGLGAGLKAASKVPRLAKTLGGAATGRVGASAAQGASEGAILGGPDNRGLGAAMGGGAGGAFSSAGKLLRGRLNKAAEARKLGHGKGMTTGMTDDARRLLGQETQDPRTFTSRPALMDVDHIPISQATDDDSLVGMFYRGIVGNLPGGGQALRGQLRQAQAKARENVLKKAFPSGVPDPVASVIDTGDSLQASMHRLADVWSRGFDNVKNHVYLLPQDIKAPKAIQEAMDAAGISLPKAGSVIKGDVLTQLRINVQKIIDDLPRGGLAPERRAAISFKKQLDEVIQKNLDPKNKVSRGVKRLSKSEQDYKDFLENLDKYKNWEIIQNAASKNKGTSEFSMKQLADAASQKAGRKGLQGQGGVLQEIGQAGSQALREFPSNMGIFQMYAALGAAGIGGYMGSDQGLSGIAKGAVGGLAAPYVLSKGLAHPATQRFLMGRAKKSGPKSSKLVKALDAKGRLGVRRGAAYGFGGRQLGVAATSPEDN